MCNAINEAIIGTLQEGLVCSASLMIVCPWALQAINFLKGHPDISFLIFNLAREYGLAFRVTGQPVNKSVSYAQMLRELPAGLSEWAVHPGFDNAELLALEPDGQHIRQTDFDFLISQRAKDIIKEEGIILVNYRALQEVWRKP